MQLFQWTAMAAALCVLSACTGSNNSSGGGSSAAQVSSPPPIADNQTKVPSDTTGASTNLICTTSETVCLPAKFLYVWNSMGIDIYAVDPSSGSLLSKNVTSVCPNTAFSFDPTDTYAYVACSSPAQLQSYTIDHSTGVLSPSSSVSTDNALGGIILDPLGRFMYHQAPADSGMQFSWSSINTTNGQITPHGVVTAAVPCEIMTQAGIDGKGRYLYQACWGGPHSAYIYLLNQVTGEPSYVGAYDDTLGCDFAGLQADASGNFAVAACQYSNQVELLSINQNTGALSAIAIYSTTPHGGPGGPDWIGVDSSGELIYTWNQDDGSSSVFGINQGSGSLSYFGNTNPSWGIWNGLTRIPGMLGFMFMGNNTSISLISFNQLTGAMGLMSATPTDAGAGTTSGLAFAKAPGVNRTE